VKKGVLIILLLAAGLSSPAYNDYRGHNLDSLERVVARWTPDAVDNASEEDLVRLNRAYRDLMLGYQQLNQEKFLFYARKALSVSRPRGWRFADADACRFIGQYFYSREQWDSAQFYYNAALSAISDMEAGATSPTAPEGYSESEIDDTRSALYGAMGNMYNMMGDIPQAMEYYEKAGEIFEKYGWNESNAILHYNMGETWLDKEDFHRAKAEYDMSLSFAEASGDTLMIVEAWKGLGRLYTERGRTRKALYYLRKADAYYASHAKEEAVFRAENLENIKRMLSLRQKRLGMLAGILTGLVLVAAGFLLRRRKEHRAAASAGPDAPSPDAPALSDREKEILDLLSKGYTTPQIAEALCLSPETVKWYRKKLLVKFDVANTAELVAAAQKEGRI
jgi:DNA-binding CsgD family transcriptional regulator